MRTTSLPLDLIDAPPDRLRLNPQDSDIEGLARDIKQNGLINPVHVRQVGDRYQLVAGERRYLACYSIGRDTIEATIYDNSDTVDDYAISIAENFHRRDMTPIEEAIALLKHATAHSLDNNGVARAVNRPVAWVDGRMALLEYPEDLQEAVHDRTLPLAAARHLALVTDAAHRHYLTGYCTNHGASASTIRAWVDEWVNARATHPEAPAPLPDLAAPVAPPVVVLPCTCCRTPTPHTELGIVRVCHHCLAFITDSANITRATTDERE